MTITVGINGFGRIGRIVLFPYFILIFFYRLCVDGLDDRCLEMLCITRMLKSKPSMIPSLILNTCTFSPIWHSKFLEGLHVQVRFYARTIQGRCPFWRWKVDYWWTQDWCVRWKGSCQHSLGKEWCWCIASHFLNIKFKLISLVHCRIDGCLHNHWKGIRPSQRWSQESHHLCSFGRCTHVCLWC